MTDTLVHALVTRLIVRQRNNQHITPVLIELHWLPVRWRGQHKLLVSALYGLAPGYMSDLRSADLRLLVVPDRQYGTLCRFVGLHKTSRYAVYI